MSDVYIVAYDGSDGSQRAANFAAGRASLAQAALHLVYVLEWSPYSFLTADELAERHARRREELERANLHVLSPMLASLHANGTQATGEVRYGNVAKTLVEVATEQSAKLIYIAKAADTGLMQRVLGNVPSTLIQIATIPVAVVP